MLKLTNLHFTYNHSDEPVLKNLNLELLEGEFVLLQGSTGSGKSTLLKTINGLAPHFTGGRMSGSIQIGGIETSRQQPHDLAESVGFVNQQPESAFATDTVEEELAFGLEHLGWPVNAIAERIAELSVLFGFQGLMTRPLVELSGGQQQSVAIASAMAARQKLLLLDEPTSALDSEAAASIARTLKQLAEVEGITILVAEHRLERLLPFADRSIYLDEYGTLSDSAPTSIQGQEPLLRNRLAGENIALECLNITETRGTHFRLESTDIHLREGEIVGIQGENGAGKSTLLSAVFERATRQRVNIAMVPQNASDLLFLSTVSDELADSELSPERPTAAQWLERLLGRIDPRKHPRDLSSGQQLALVLGIQLARDAKILILDEPTRGLDTKSKNKLRQSLAELRNLGHTILIATHDDVFLTGLADRVIRMKSGRIEGDLR
jgi:energy-coupling factor transport system ATP-binding protein